MSRRLLVLGLVFALAPALRAQSDTASAQRTIRAIEEQWLATSDSATLDRILAQDFLHVVGPGQTITKAQHIAWAVKHPRPSTRHARFDALVIRVFGDAAVATGTVAVADDATHTTSRDSFTDVFVYRDGSWRAVSAQETAAAAPPS
ncbi:MAG: nuclear transport factor 2 family protein [Gemmatimonadaceae bacterium]